jgi:integrase
LEPDVEPYDRVSRERLKAYYNQLRLHGNSDATIIGRFSELAMSMRVLAPKRDSGWIRKPFGHTMYALLPKRSRPLVVPSADIMLAWGYLTLEQSSTAATERERLVGFRDGLLITLFATCARRLRAVSGLRIGHEFISRTGGYRIELPAELVKTGKPDCFDLPGTLTPHIDSYIHTVRPKLLGDKQSEHLWISSRGKPCTPTLIQARILELSKDRFGVAFGPHRFRHSVGTSAPHLDPTNMMIGAEVLGISPCVVQAHYNRGAQALAMAAYAECIDARTAAAETLVFDTGLHNPRSLTTSS